ncbi:MAG TPA: transcription-repair coupling factor [Bacillus bacterium]|nr:transcription-repair coupling factor [Bacillus sp. (in: firmicutes)]
MLGLRSYIIKNGEVKTVASGFNEGLKEQLVAGLSGSARALFIAAMYIDTKQPQLVVTHNLYQAQKIYDDLVEILGEDEVYLYPVNELIAAEIAIASPELKGQRIDALNHWCSRKNGILIAPVAGLRRVLPPLEIWKKSQIYLEVGKELNIESFLLTLVKMGYERASMVSTPGEFSIRGGIIDIYPLTEERPLRIELFDTEIDSIRYFDIEDQRSLQTVKEIALGPATEVILFDEHFAKGAELLEQGLAKSLKKVSDRAAKEALSENIAYEIEQLKRCQPFPEMYKYMALYYESPASLLDYLPENGIVVMDEISRIQEISQSLDKEEAEWQISLIQAGNFIVDLSIHHHFHDLLEKARHPLLYLSLFLRHVPHTHPENIINFTCKTMQSFHGQMDLLKGELERWKKGNYAVVFLAANDERMGKLANVLADYNIDAEILARDSDLSTARFQIMQGALSSGFELPMQHLAVITEEELFKKRAKKIARRQKLSNAERIKSYSELKVGDYVVHINHGIGKYLGIETLEINGVHKDYLHLRYSGNDKLYVPVEQIDQVQKYVASEGKEPKIYKLGGSDWKKVKTKVQKSVQNIADDLIKLYAEREASKGYAFSEDGEEQRELEASFQYQETEDQLRCIEEIKKDMENERPMDRLLCGDVGYGKTEVAIRAVFKAILDGKQVAFLVPTTILAQQHYETIRERFQGFPIEVGLLSRFRTKKQQTETIKGLKAGTVDVVIGTHRILSKDIAYRDLGLLVIDEEQRFGVTHKEKIKKLKANVDVLTLTATPIPRTLHMSMLGVRDLSVIETPPENRFPIQTYVAEYNLGLVREAIERELARDGQIYFLYNRVEDIERKAEEISMLVPDARVTYAHGQMNENELESVILSFLEGEYDVLVSTTIIETGVDIPNVNTLIVYDADKMGLSQLYQLRGRVGRSNRVAYAYFTYQKDKILTEVAEKRLQAIKEFTELGSGFKIAMRDLSIRGAGNLLGAEQHGFIDSVGFDLYSQMLKEAIEERRGKQDEPVSYDVEINLEIDAYIPAAYIQDEKQKIDMYKRFRSLDTIEDVEDLQDEMIDRFGEFPKEVEYLFRISRLKVHAKKQKVESVIQKKNEIWMLMDATPEQISKVVELSAKYVKYIRLGQEGDKLKIITEQRGQSIEGQFKVVESFLTELNRLEQQVS